MCFFLRLFFFFVASVLGGSGGSSGSATSSSAFAVLCSTSEIQNRWLSVGIGEVARWAGTSCCGVNQEHMEGTSPTHTNATLTDQMLRREINSDFRSIWYDGKKKAETYILLLRLLDKKGFSVVTELHVQVDWLSVDFNVNLEEFDHRT